MSFKFEYIFLFDFLRGVTVRELEPVKVQARRSHSVPLWYYNSGLVSR
jgi:hypothetical protein